MPNAPGFYHQKWMLNLPTPMFNAITDVGAPLGLGGKYPDNAEKIY